MPPGSTGSITVSDTLDDVPRGLPRTLTFGAGDAVDLSLRNVPFLLGDDIDVVSDKANSPGAFPRWLTDNKWHHYLYYAFSASDAIGGTGCTPGIDCLNLEIYSSGVLPDVTFNDVKGVVVAAGADLAAPRSNTIDDFFDKNNGTPADNEFAEAPISGTFNDQVQILKPNE